MAVRVASLLKGKGLVFEWLIAGDGPLRGELEKLIERRGFLVASKLLDA